MSGATNRRGVRHEERPLPGPLKLTEVDPADFLRFFETLTGRGDVYAGGRRLAGVDYLLKDVEEVVYKYASGGGSGSEAVAGERTIYGMIRSPEAEAVGRHVGEALTLRLQDGRALDFAVAKALLVEQRVHTFLIQGFGGLRPAAPESGGTLRS
ncbi:hypothetical protein tb265_44660 [Gemmatimonadetes bacterium T265]|nr:hypothetical protein tb265_44660 [Gemmatimonadetes bacterium T265]